MCEEQTAIKALSFLQNDVASVVDHVDPKESDEFRSLMQHLLSPSASLGASSRTSSTSTVRAGPTPSPSRQAPEAEVHSYPDHQLRPPEGSDLLSRRARTFELYRVDEGEDGEEERDGEAETSESDEDHGGGWTNDMPELRRQPEKDDLEEIVVEDAGKRLSVKPDALLDAPDPIEFQNRSKAPAASKNEIPSGLRYQQRTEVFEVLLEYVGDDDKQPSGSLLDLVGEGGGGGTLTSAGIGTAELKARFIR